MTNAVIDALGAASSTQPQAPVDAAQTRVERLARLHAAADARSAAALSSSRAAAETVPETFRKFEGMVLQTFIQSMLPQDAEAVYGSGLAGDMWKSFMATEIANQMAKAGGIGIAEKVLGAHYMAGEKTVPVTGLPGAAEQTGLAQQQLLSAGLVQEMQRSMMKTLGEDLAAAGRSSAD
ncbi:MAG: rod-binding protein [Mesorhizobium sp.]|nr:rod-binding protein [Mesorhizobium sp.]MCO5162593.1 rod-binding protein [Mesorhizobium sp.]